jgi:uncharacterized protein YlzI (FlbEa/FlbD family)
MKTTTITLANTEKIVVRTHYPGVYRVSLTSEHFG